MSRIKRVSENVAGEAGAGLVVVVGSCPPHHTVIKTPTLSCGRAVMWRDASQAESYLAKGSCGLGSLTPPNPSPDPPPDSPNVVLSSLGQQDSTLGRWTPLLLLGGQTPSPPPHDGT